MQKRLIFTSDLLSIRNNEYFSLRVLAWAFPFLEQQIKFAVGDITPYDSRNKEFFDPEKFYELCGYEPNTGNWINICSGKYTDEALEYFKSCFKDCIVITQEAGSLIQFFEKLNIPYIDFYISAIRFCPDIYLAFRSNVPEVVEKLKLYKIREEQFYIEAGALKGFYGRKNLYEDIEENSLLLCGQTDIDLSLIKNGNIVKYTDYKDKMEELCSKYNKIYYKRHPYCGPDSENEQYILSLPNVEVTNKNTYEMICHNNIKAVAALSSGVLTEAKYFGKVTITISHEYVKYWDGKSKIKPGEFITVVNDFKNPKFWADILSPLVEKVNYLDIKIPNEGGNLFRHYLEAFWGYEVDNENLIKTRVFINECKIDYTSELLERRTIPLRSVRRVVSCLVPVKSWRKKIRGEDKGEDNL